MKFFVVLIFVIFIQIKKKSALETIVFYPLDDENPGVKVCLTTKGLNYAASIAAGLIANKVYKTKIDDISGKEIVKYTVDNIKITNFRQPVPEISMIPSQGIKLNLRNAALSASGHWKYRKHFVKDSGSVEAHSDPISIGLSIDISVDSTGRPRLQAHSCDVSLGGFNIKVHGGASFLYNILLKAFKGKAKSKMEEGICNGAIDAINTNGNNQLATLNMQSKISEGLVLDYSLTGPVTFSPTYLETSHRGIFLEDPELPKIPLIGTSSSTMVGFSIAAEAFNSAGRVIFAKQLINKDFDIPSIKNLLVKLDSRFTNSSLFFKISPSSAPKINIVTDLFTIELEAEAELIAKMPDQSMFSVMTADLGLEATTAVELKEEKIILQLEKFTPNIRVKVSHIGIIPLNFLNFFLQQIINLSLPVINNKLKKGFPLPNVSNVKFPNASIRMLPGYLSVASDIIYQP